MDPKPHYTIVGIIVSVIFCGLVLWLSWLWRAGAKDQTSFYLINFRKQSLAGLQIDGIVTLRGLRVGKIKSIDIDSQDVENALVKIAINRSVQIKQDTRATIARNLLTGLASIDLLSSSANSPVLTADSSALPVIQEGEAGFDQIFLKTPELISNLNIAVEKVSGLLSEQNIKAASNTLSNLETASNKLIPAVDNLQTTIANIQTLTSETKGKMGPMLDQLNSSAKEAQISMQNISSDFEKITSAASNLSNSLKEPRTAILGLPSGQLGPGEETN